jgi:hypothetical protein
MDDCGESSLPRAVAELPTRWSQPLAGTMISSQHVYEIRPRKDHRGADLISDALPFGRLWYLEVSNAIDYAKFYSRSHHGVIRVYVEAGNVIETHEHTGTCAHERSVVLELDLLAAFFVKDF